MKKMWKIVKGVAVYVRNRWGGCPRGVGGKRAKNGSLMDGGEEWRERDVWERRRTRKRAHLLLYCRREDTERGDKKK